MKTVTFGINSWHFKLTNIMFNNCHHNESICGYFWKVLFSASFFIFGLFMCFLLLFVASLAITDVAICLWFYVTTGLWLGNPYTEMTIAIILFGVLLLFVIALVYRKEVVYSIRLKINPNYRYEMLKNKYKEPKPPGFFRLVYRAYKDKFCVMISFE